MLSTLLLLVLACGDKEIQGDGGATSDGGGDGPQCDDDNDCGTGRICEDEACVDGDRNNSVDEAERLLWDSTVTGIINPKGDVDYFVFTADGGEWLRLRTTVTDSETQDTAITLRTASGKIVTRSDNYPTGHRSSSSDATIYAWLANAGEYYVQVEDQGTYNENGEEVGARDYSYTLELLAWSQVSSEPDAADDPSLSLGISSTSVFMPVGAVLEEDGDSDFIQLTVGVGGAHLWLYGILRLDGTDADPALSLWTAEGEELVRQRGVANGGYAWYPYLPAGTYTLEMRDGAGQGGDNHWFALFPIAFEADGSYPVESEPNDSMGAARSLSMSEATTSSGATYAYGNLTGYIDALGDEDWIRVPGRSGAELVVCLSSARGGSLVTPDIEVYDSGGELLASDLGSAAVVPNASVEDITMGGGDLYLRIVDPDGEYAGAGAWYRLVVYTADFSVSSYAEGGYSCPS